MKVSIYSTAFNAIKYSFNFKDALDNWALYADEISIAVNTSEDNTLEEIGDYAKLKGYPVSIIQTSFDYKNDPFAYGQIENAALQNCTGDLLIQQNLDERFRVSEAQLKWMHDYLQKNPTVSAFFIPTIDLYGSYERASKIARKWYVHRAGLFRGAVSFGIKANGRPDYDKTSTDELLDITGNLVSTKSLLDDLSIESLRDYVSKGMPVSYHLGFFDLKSRAERAAWWKEFWENATGGDSNTHITDVAELEKKHTFAHELPLWLTKS